MQDSLKILETVNNFYTQSFSQLINITVAVLAFAGIVLPILITFYQKRLFKLEHEVIENSLHKKMNEELGNALAQIKLEYEAKESKFESKIEEMKEELHREVDNAKGGISHVQGCNLLAQKDYFLAFESFVQASFGYIKSKENLNLRRVISVISDNCLPNMNSKHIEDNDEAFSQFEELLDKLSKYDTDGSFTDQLRNLRRDFSQCKKRKSPKQGAV
jgi:hypothetical protein